MSTNTLSTSKTNGKEIPNKEKRKYSWLQYCLWLIAGSEIGTLKKCPNDYNRHANVGMMILITSLFASITSFIAGHEFAENNKIGVGVFAGVWAILILSLDRSMVNSIKKDPSNPKESMWGYFWPRLILAIILSFFMTIPVDHIIFKEKIETQMAENNTKAWLQRQKDLTMGFNIKSDSSRLGQTQDQVDDVEAKLNSDCTIPNYISLKTEIDLLKKRRSNISPRIPYYDKYGNKKSRKNPNYTILSIEINSKSIEAQNIYQPWHRNLIQEQARLDSVRNNIANRLNKNSTLVATAADTLRQKQEKLNGFDTKFTTLFMMPDFGVQFLKWLLFLALLVIEILPTYLKLKTPIGQYDWEMYNQEKETELLVKARIDALETSLPDIEDYRSQKEIILNKKIIDKAVEIEEELANEMLVEWELKAKEQIKEKVTNAN